MSRQSRASLIVSLSLLTWASTASAECAWVMWQQLVAAGVDGRPDPLQPLTAQYSVMGAYPDKAMCEAVLAEIIKLKPRSENLLRCLPDTVDPRGAKGAT